MATLYTVRSGATQHPEAMLGFLSSRMVTTGGVVSVDSNHFLVAQQSVPDMTVLVNNGYALIPLSDNTYVHPVYLTGGDASVTISANSSGNARIDAVILYIDRAASANTTATNVALLTKVTGTPAATPVAPTDAEIATSIGASNPFIRLANVAVANGASSIVTANITDTRKEPIYDNKIVKSDSGIFRNAIINGNMDIWQRGTTFTAATTPANSDDTYLTDRWILLAAGADTVDISRSTDKPDGSSYSMKLDVQTSARFGICQILENKDVLKLDNKRVSFSFAAKTESSEITTLRVAILTWGSTADSVTSDVVGTWGATITPAANWTLENTPEDITITNSWATYKVENVSIDTATVNNLAVLIYTPSAESINDTFYLSQVQLNEGTRALDYKPKSFLEELQACKRYYQKSFPYATTPAQAAGTSGALFLYSHETTQGRTAFFNPEMRATPTVTTYSTVSANNQWYDATNGQDRGVAQDSASSTGINLYSTTFAAGAYVCYINWSADIEL